MTTPSEFFDKLKALKPDHDLTSGVAFIAILHHDKVPNEPLQQHDALWIKCPKGKALSSLLKAYKKKYLLPDELVLRHNFKVVDETTKISALLTLPSDDFVALEAILADDLETRVNAPTTSRTALAEVTNTANQLRIKDDPSSKDAAALPTNPLVTQLTHPIAALSASNAQDHHVRSMASPTEEEGLGWEDFLFERLEYQRQFLQREITDALSERIRHEWLCLDAGQRSYFSDRASRISATARSMTVRRVHHIAFWLFYYEKYLSSQNAGIELHVDFPSQRRQFDVSVELWSRIWGLQEHAGYMNKGMALWAEIIDKYADILSFPPSENSGPEPCSENVAKLENSRLERSPEGVAQVVKEEPVRSPFPEDRPDPPKDSLVAGNSFHVGLESGMLDAQECTASRMTMSELFDGRTPEQLEKSVQKGAELLNNIQHVLRERPNEEVNQWIQALEKVQSQAVRSRTVVGVVGATGAGKSSVINAMLDEERLVPTNCMRACTAVVTEISYNYDESIPYRAEIEFISREDWNKMLKVLFQDLLDGSGQVSRECINEDSESGIAYAQVKAVYPKLTKDEMAKVPIERLMAHENVKCLGTIRKAEAFDASDFYKQLQNYVDSKEKGSARKDNGEKGNPKAREMEFWPLIRVVRLHVKAPALATGAVIVDLPGVHDSNQARAAVAQGYMKQCTGLWIVAPITRAVDDKSAKNLLGDSFKRQLKMDGGYNSVTFICSKTDDISITEAQDSLGLADESGQMLAKMEDLRRKKITLKQQIEGLKATKSDINAAIEAQDEQVEIWEKLQEDCQAGQTVYQPKPATKKRKRMQGSNFSRKKSKYAEPGSDDDFIIDDDDEGDSNSDGGSDFASSINGEDRGPPLTEDEISRKLGELRVSKREGRRQKIQVGDEMRSLRKQIEQIDKDSEAIDAELFAKCISGRNEYSRAAIRQDYASGIRELDQELAEEADAANFNPEVDARDYDEVARNLPVFCVSSRAYQKLKGRLQRDKTPPGFEDLEETEMPALQAHCVQLTTADRTSTARRFLNSTFQFLNSLRLWASNDGTGNNLSDDQLQHEARILKDKLKKLDSALEKAATNVVLGIDCELKEKIYDVFPSATSAAKSLASGTVRQWGAPINRDNRAEGGLHWGTYKAVVRRDGCFSNSWRSINFNAELVDPILRSLTGPWESVFARKIPSILGALPLDVSGMLRTFHDEVESHAIRNGALIATFETLKHQLPGYKDIMKDAMVEARTKVTETQREINREFEPSITKHMQEIYEICVEESGIGSYSRMRAHMAGFVEREKDSMFEGSVKHVKVLLRHMLEELKEELLTKVDMIFMAVQKDYTGVFSGSGSSKTTGVLPREQRALRKPILELVDSAELVFKRAVDVEPEAEPEADDQTSGNPETDVAETGASDHIKNEVNDDTKMDGSAETVAKETVMDSNVPDLANQSSPREPSTVPKEPLQSIQDETGLVKGEQDSI
ncbi:hypothetical protein H2204_009614 [Knufia peltigerae]|uniref:Tat pathway signal sequence n=1 Tax=Knufia peltigerae TaxID=1002370 RepID=A0AA38XY17_9EURO|nr:hypothetical protein H2204_009614 [Knufia peltigerae]